MDPKIVVLYKCVGTYSVLYKSDFVTYSFGTWWKKCFKENAKSVRLSATPIQGQL